MFLIRLSCNFVLVAGTLAFPSSVFAQDESSQEKKVDKNKKIEQFVNSAVQNGGFQSTNTNHFERLGNLQVLCRKDPEGAVWLINRTMTGLDLNREQDRGTASRAVTLLAAVGNDAALEKLDDLYIKWSGTPTQRENWKRFSLLRRTIIYSLHSNPLYVDIDSKRAAITLKKKKCLKLFEKWLKQENDSETLVVGLRRFSDFAQHADKEFIVHARKIAPAIEVQTAVRKIKMNNLKDYRSVFKEAMRWIDEIIDTYDGKQPAKLANHHLEDNVHDFLYRKLYSNIPKLKKQTEDLIPRLRRSRRLVAEREPKLKQAKIRRRAGEPWDYVELYAQWRHISGISNIMDIEKNLKRLQKQDEKIEPVKGEGWVSPSQFDWISPLLPYEIPKQTERPLRKWTNNTGDYSVEAKFVEFKQGKVLLKKADGDTISLPLSQLSKADQEYVKKTLPESLPKKPTPKKPAPK